MINIMYGLYIVQCCCIYCTLPELEGFPYTTQSRLMSESLYWCVHENLTLHRVKKIIFSLYHLKKQIRSFPTMYNTWGCSWGQIGEIIFFLQKSGLKTPILAATVLDHPTSKWAGTHNFKDIANFHRCFKKFGT